MASALPDPHRFRATVDRDENEISVVIFGDFDRYALDALEQTLSPIMAGDSVRIDLRCVTTIDSAAIGRLVTLREEIVGSDGSFVTLVSQPFQQRVFEITSLVAILNVENRP